MNTVLCQTVLKSSFCILAKLLTTGPTRFYVITQLSSFTSDLSYTTGNNPILRINLNYKKLLKCINATNLWSIILITPQLLYTKPTHFLDTMPQSLFLCLSFFTCIMLFKSITLSNKSNNNNISGIFKIIII